MSSKFDKPEPPPIRELGRTDRYVHYGRIIPPDYGDGPVGNNSQDVFVYDNMLAVTQSTLTEKKYSSGKVGRYYHRHRDDIFTFHRRTREGNVMLRIKRVPYGDFTFKSFNRISQYSNDGFDDFVRNEVVKMARANGLIVRDEWIDNTYLYQFIAYPLFGEWVHRQGVRFDFDTFVFERDFALLSRGFLRENLRDFVLEVYGKRFARKDIIKQVAKTFSLSRLAALARHKSLFGPDLALTFLRTEDKLALDSAVYSYDDVRNLRVFVKSLTPALQKRILLFKEGNDYLIRDTLAMYGRLVQHNYYRPQFIDFRNWRTLHDSFARLQRDMYAELGESQRQIDNLRLIEQKRFYKTLDNSEVVVGDSSYRLESAKNVGVLRDWGQEMSNCIAGYGDRALNHRSYLFGVYKGNTLLANMELTDKGEMVQLYGKYNAPLEPDVTDAIRTHVATNGRKRKIEEISK